jgi:two-component system, OmpR family, phosphate regulon sensor histidine kinase PhoR
MDNCFMNLSQVQSHKPARRLVACQAMQIAVICLIAWLVAGGLPTSLQQTLIVGGLVTGASLTSALLTVKLLSPLMVWHRRLSRLDGKDFDPMNLVKSSADSAADRGWNNLVEQGQLWQSLSTLRTQVDLSLAGSQSGEAARLLDAVASAIAHVDAEGKIVYANSMMAGICGTESSSDLIGKPFSETVKIPRPSELSVESSSTLANDTEWSVADGSSSRSLRGQRRSMPNGSESVWTIRDVTQQRLAESMREKFLTAATHEFRTPLANIRAYAESLDMGHDIDPEARKHFYNVIQSESQRLSQLVDDLLDISRMQAGALSLDRNEIDLRRLVEEAASKIQGQATDKQQQLRVEFPPKFPKLAGDKNMLSAALVNLLGNAVKYTPEGGKISFRVDANSRFVQFSVSDTGIGIAPEELSDVFDRFFRSEDDRVQTISGSGLGLSLVQEVARLHGGDVYVESVLNQGSTFRIEIPLT